MSDDFPNLRSMLHNQLYYWYDEHNGDEAKAAIAADRRALAEEGYVIVSAEDMAKLNAAEKVCILYGWTPPGDSEREKACSQLWQEWAALVGSDFTAPKAHPELPDERIAEL